MLTLIGCIVEPDAVPLIIAVLVLMRAPLVGDVIYTVGGIATVIVTEELAVFPLESVTVAVIVCVPDVRAVRRNDHVLPLV